MLLAALVLAASVTPSSCWGVYDAAMYRSAHVPHARVITYDETFSLRQGDTPVTQQEKHVRYGDDAASDPEPGPPDLGPYGSARNRWLGTPAQLSTIARLRVSGDIQCVSQGTETAGNHSVYHITFQTRAQGVPQISDLWVDTRTADIWKLAGYGTVFFNDGAKRIAQFTITLDYVGRYLLVNDVVWTSGLYVGEYHLHNFAFPLDGVMGKAP